MPISPKTLKLAVWNKMCYVSAMMNKTECINDIILGNDIDVFAISATWISFNNSDNNIFLRHALMHIMLVLIKLPMPKP